MKAAYCNQRDAVAALLTAGANFSIVSKVRAHSGSRSSGGLWVPASGLKPRRRTALPAPQ